MTVPSFIVVAMETKVVSEARGAEVESEPGAEFQPLLWDVDVGRRLCTGTVVAYLSLFALVTSSLRTCGEPDSTQKSSCFGAAAMMLTAFAMTRLRRHDDRAATLHAAMGRMERLIVHDDLRDGVSRCGQ